MIQPTTTDPLSNEVLLGRGKMTKLPLKIIQIKNTHTHTGLRPKNLKDTLDELFGLLNWTYTANKQHQIGDLWYL